MRWVRWFLVLAGMLILTGCGETPVKQPETVGFSCNFTATYGELTLAGTLTRASAGMLTVTLQEPKTLSGVTLCCDGQKTTVSLGMLQYTLDETLPQTAFLPQICRALDDAYRQAAGTLCEDGFLVAGDDYRLLSSPQTGELLSLEIPAAKLAVRFTGMRKEE